MRIDGLLQPTQKSAPTSTSGVSPDQARRFQDLVAAGPAGKETNAAADTGPSSRQGGAQHQSARAGDTDGSAAANPSAAAGGAASQAPAFGFDALGPFARTGGMPSGGATALSGGPATIGGLEAAGGVNAAAPPGAAMPLAGITLAVARPGGAGGLSSAVGTLMAGGAVTREGTAPAAVSASKASGLAANDELAPIEGADIMPGAPDRKASQAGPQLLATTEGAQTSVVAQAIGFDVEGAPALREALGRAAADLGYSLNQLTFNGAAVPPASIARGGGHGSRRGQ